MARSIPVSNAAISKGGLDFFGSGNNELNLANGMTAGYGVGAGAPAFNPPLPITSAYGAPINPYGGMPKWQPQRCGVMRNLPGSLPNNAVAYLFFLYNPNEVSSSFMINTSQAPPSLTYQGVQAGSTTLPPVPALTSGQSVGWSLMFDRTYDMMYDTNPGENRGVLKDTAALYNLMGTFFDYGMPYSVPIQVVFGKTSSGQLWGFTGYITGVNITYGIFRNNMIPSRAEVDLQMTAVYVGSQVPTIGPGSSGSASTSSNPNKSKKGSSTATTKRSTKSAKNKSGT